MPHPFFKIVKSAIVGSLVISLVVSALPECAFASESKKTSQDLEKTLIQIRSQESLDQSITFLAAAMVAWNPSLKKYNVKKILTERIQKVGVMEGVVLPTITLIDMSYAAGVPRFGSLLNPMLNELAPSIAMDINKKFQLPLDYKGESFGAISKRNSLPQLIESFQARLDNNFNSQISSKPQSAELNQKQDLFHQVLIGPGSYLKYRAGQLGNTNEAPQNLKLPGSKNPSEGGSFGKEIEPLPKGLFSNLDMASYRTCTAECFSTSGDFILKGIKVGGFVGGTIGAVGGPLIAGKGGILGGVVGAAVGLGVGLNECSTSKACSGIDEPKPQNIQEEPKPSKTPVKNDPDSGPKPEPRPTPENEESEDSKGPKDPKFDFGPDSPRQQVDDNNNIQTDNDRNVATPQNPNIKEDQNRQGSRNSPPTTGPTVQRDQPKLRGPNYVPSAIDPSHVRLDPKRGPKVNPPVTDPMHGRL